MRKIFVLVLFALLAGVGVVALIETDPGYILVSYGNYTLETSFWVGLLLLLLFTLLLYVAMRLVHKIVVGQHSLASWLGSRKGRASTRQTTRGLVNFLEGNWARARRQLLRGARDSEVPLVNYLVAARSSYRLNEPDRMQENLVAAEAAEPGAGIAVTIARAELKLDAGLCEQALSDLEPLRENAGRHPYVLELLQRAYRELGDHEKLAALLPELGRHRAMPEQELQQLERELTVKSLEQSAATGTATAADRLPAAWQRVPQRLREDQKVVGAYVRLLVEQGAHGEAEKVIGRTLKRDWNPQLVRLYGYVDSGNPPRQLSRGEAWLAEHPGDAELLLCLGRLAARDRLWGKARDYFESSYRLERRPETCAELGRLLVALGEPKVGAAYFREGLMSCEAGLPDLPLPENLLPPTRRQAGS